MSEQILPFAPREGRPIPPRADVVVIGGGVVGVSAALTLADRGYSVALCEKGRIAGEQSSRNWGWIRMQGRDPREIPLMIEAQTLWRQYAARLPEEIGLRQNGVAYLALEEAELARHAAWLDVARPYQLASRLLTPAEAAARAGQENGRFAGGIFMPSDMHAEPALAVPALARLAARQGAAIFEHTAVRAVERSAGRISGVVTEHGTIACERVILAGGVWARPFLENMGLSLPQLAIRAQAFRTTPVEPFLEGPLGTGPASIRPRADGGLTIGRTGAARFDLVPAAFAHVRPFLPLIRERWRILKLRAGPEFFGALGRHRWAPDQMSPFETMRVFDPAPDRALARDTLRAAARMFPRIAGARIAEMWGGMIDVMPDEVPAIGTPRGADGLVLATGLSGHGFGLGTGVGVLAADLATGAPPVVDPAPFSPDRF